MLKLRKLCKKCIKNLDDLSNNADKLLESNDTLSLSLRETVKEIYDFTKSQEKETLENCEALSELIITDFDHEQIWQQIELQNEPFLSKSLQVIAKTIAAQNKSFIKKVASTGPKSNQQEENSVSNLSNKDESDTFSENSNFDEKHDLDELEPLNENSKDNNSPRKIKSSIVDDQFFKLGEMEQFLENEEKMSTHIRSESNENESLSEDENDIDYFEEDDDEDDNDDMKTAKYKDFFVAKTENQKSTKRNKFLESVAHDDECIEESDVLKSTFEERQERLQERIAEIENRVGQEKPWQLKGEITANARPHNSLLEEVVEFDLVSRPAPVITEQTTVQLEDIIIERIKNKVFDDVIRKEKPIESVFEYKKTLVLNQEKSKQSLAQIYENEYLDQKVIAENPNAEKIEEVPEDHIQIDKLMTNLFNQLDALSNYHFTPKPAIPDLKIVNNLPALTIEEVAPEAISDAALLAPEEVKTKQQGDVVSKDERTKTDKKRERRSKKQKQRKHAIEKCKKIAKSMSGMGNKYTKEKHKKLLQDVTKQKNVDKMEESNHKAVKSSTAFFTQLQDEVQSQLKERKKRKASKKGISAKKLKL